MTKRDRFRSKVRLTFHEPRDHVFHSCVCSLIKPKMRIPPLCTSFLFANAGPDCIGAVRHYLRFMKAWNKVGVVGAGTMGSGIAQIAAQAGCEVVLVDSSEDALQRSQEKLGKVFARLVEKGRVTSSESESVQQRITRQDLESLAPCDMVIEAIVEDLDIKTALSKPQALWQKMPFWPRTPHHCPSQPWPRVHPSRSRDWPSFLQPCTADGFGRGDSCAADGCRSRQSCLGANGCLGQVAGPVGHGFIVNRVARPFYSEALRILEEGIASVQDIDASLRAQGFRMKPFELMDLIGHDVNYAVTSSVPAAFYGDSYRPSHTQRQLVAANWLGANETAVSTYEGGVRQGNEGQCVEGVAERILAMLMNEAADAVFGKWLRPQTLTQPCKERQLSQGPLGLGRQLGHSELINIMDSLRHRYGEERYKSLPCFATWHDRDARFSADHPVDQGQDQRLMPAK